MQLFRSAIEKDVTRREIKLGQKVSDNALPIGRSILIDICDTPLKVRGQSYYFILKSIHSYAFLTDHNSKKTGEVLPTFISSPHMNCI